MKRLIYFCVAALMLLGCSTDRSAVLKVYNWADYIDEELLDEFEEWYFEQTGENVSIVYQTFDINETMLSKIELGHEDYDVVCPSDYIIERMLRNDLLLPIDRNFGDTQHRTFLKSLQRLKGREKMPVTMLWGTCGEPWDSYIIQSTFLMNRPAAGRFCAIRPYEARF